MNHWWKDPVVTSTATDEPGWSSTNLSAMAWYESRSVGMFQEDSRRCRVPVSSPAQAARAPVIEMPATASICRRDGVGGLT